MGEENTRPIIIEFNGLPGSGKSTIARSLKKELLKKNYKCFSSFSRSRFMSNAYLVILDFHYWRLIYHILISIRNIPSKSKLKWTLISVYFLKMYRDFQRVNGVGCLIMDQGFIQSLISLAHNCDFSEFERLDDVLIKSRLNDLNIVFINCLNSVEVSSVRIAGREPNGSRVHSLDKKELNHLLRKQADNLIFLRNRIIKVFPKLTTININTKETVENNVNVIIRSLNNNDIK